MIHKKHASASYRLSVNRNKKAIIRSQVQNNKSVFLPHFLQQLNTLRKNICILVKFGIIDQ